MLSFHRFVACALLCTLSGLVLTNLSGCGPKEQTVTNEPSVVPTPVENLRASLTELAESGQKNSGTEMMKDDIEKLRDIPGGDPDTLKKDLDDLLATPDGNGVKTKAKAMLGKLP
ncbi:hypothetical protein GC163_01455 [bacterium]|nr:hypothetical protein [bacterium]